MFPLLHSLDFQNSSHLKKFHNNALLTIFQFYDYTKIYKRAVKFVKGEYPKNYHLTYSLNEDNYKEAFDILLKGGNITAVFRNELPETYKGYKVINADETDLRFTDDNNIIAGLKAKGQAKKDYSGFVLD